jgi:hypothetical protein
MAACRVEVPAGTRFGRLTVLLELPIRKSQSGGTKRWFLCRCDCGEEVSVRLGHLRSNHTQSCGRHSPPPSLSEFSPESLEKMRGDKYHGKANSPEHGVWKGITRRCYHQTCREYRNYGGRGIRMCSGWRSCFKAFYDDMGERPSPKHQIDRIDNNGHYSCGHCEECLANGWTANCQWATRAEQNRNRRDNRILTFAGETMCLADWAKRKGMHKSSLSARLEKMSVEEALRLPVRQWRSDEQFRRVPESERDCDWRREAARRHLPGFTRDGAA